MSIDPSTGMLIRLDMTAFQIEHFRANQASKGDVLWLRDILSREGEKLGMRFEKDQGNTLMLNWD